MKYLLILLIILVVAWRWRTTRSAELQARANKKDPLQAPVRMISCAHCGTHVPEQEAIAGHKASYCSAAHRALQER